MANLTCYPADGVLRVRRAPNMISAASASSLL